MIGQQVGNFEVTEMIGKGGMGVVYKARHLHINRTAAIKMINKEFVDEPQIRQRFKIEASTLAELQHPNVVDIFDYIESDETMALIMEYVEGQSLSDYIKTTTGPIPEEKAVQLFVQILDGLEYAHQRNVVHRDIKPGNFIVTNDGRVKILDFGIAKILSAKDGGLTKTGAKIGTIPYMSPEQVQGHKVNHLTDIYSLGVTLFEMLTGQCPYNPHTQSDWEIYNRIVKQPLPHPNTIYPPASDTMYAIIRKATVKDKTLRFQTCTDFKNALTHSSAVVPPKRQPPQQPPVRPQQRPRQQPPPRPKTPPPPQPATDTFDYAGFWLRFFAFILDAVLLGAIALLISVFFFAINMTDEEASVAMQFLMIFVQWLYFAKQESGPYQATPGKRTMRIKVTDTQGNPISFGRATGRYFSKILSALILGIGFIMAGFTRQKQALHDQIASCLVVRDTSR